jgi:hypothetical protein
MTGMSDAYMLHSAVKTRVQIEKRHPSKSIAVGRIR